MLKTVTSPETTNIKPGDVVRVEGNEGYILEVVNANGHIGARVHFTGDLAEFGQYQDKVYYSFTIIKEG